MAPLHGFRGDQRGRHGLWQRRGGPERGGLDGVLREERRAGQHHGDRAQIRGGLTRRGALPQADLGETCLLCRPSEGGRGGGVRGWCCFGEHSVPSVALIWRPGRETSENDAMFVCIYHLCYGEAAERVSCFLLVMLRVASFGGQANRQVLEVLVYCIVVEGPNARLPANQPWLTLTHA